MSQALQVVFDCHGGYEFQDEHLLSLVAAGFTLPQANTADDTNTVCSDGMCGSNSACNLDGNCIGINVTCNTDKFCVQVFC